MVDFYTVKSGDTLYGISRKTGIPVDSLVKYNNLDPNGILSINTKLRLSPSHDIQMSRDVSDVDIERQKYVTEKPNPNHIVKSGDNLSKIAQKYGVDVNVLMHVNQLTKESILRLDQELKIPPTKLVKNINNLSDVAKAMGVSQEFLKDLKLIEDGKKPDGKPYGDNEFHNTPYVDKTGNKTIGIGHVVKKGEKEELTNREVLETFTKDLLRMEENIQILLGSKQKYDALPQSMKEALLDMVFNKGPKILNEDMLNALRDGDYEAAINEMTNNKSAGGKELSGLSKRRLFDISTACKMYNGNIPKSNLETAQQVYNRGIELLRQECGSEQVFKNVLVGYNQDVQKFFGDKIKLITE